MILVTRSVAILAAAALSALLPAAATADGIMLVQAGAFWMGRDDGPPDEAPPAPGVRSRLLDRAPQGHQRRVRPLPERQRSPAAGPRAALRRGRRRRAHPPRARPLARRSGLRAPPGGRGLLV